MKQDSDKAFHKEVCPNCKKVYWFAEGVGLADCICLEQTEEEKVTGFSNLGHYEGEEE